MKEKFTETAKQLRELQAKIRFLKKKADETAVRLKELCSNETTSLNGYTYKRIERVGNVDYYLIPELQGVDLDQYRKDIVVSWKLTYEEQFNI